MGSFLRILLHFAVASAIVVTIYDLKTRFKDDPCPTLVAKEYEKGPSLTNVHHYTPLLALFPKEAGKFLAQNVPKPLLQGLDEFICGITPVFVGALEDAWLTSVMDLFMPLFSATLIWMSIESVMQRSGGGIPWFIVKQVPLIILLGQIGTIALFLNVVFIPAWILLQKKPNPTSAPSIDQSGGILAYSFFGLFLFGAGLLGQPKQLVLWGVTYFQFAPIVLCFLYWRPLSFLTSIPFRTMLGGDRLTAFERMYTIVIGITASLHLNAVMRLILLLVQYDNPPAYALPHVTKNPALTWESLVHFFTTINTPTEAPKILALDAVVVAAGLLLVLLLQGSGRKDGRGRSFVDFVLLPFYLVVLGPGAVFLTWARDYSLNILQNPTVVASKDQKKKQQ